jgi:hypothetical protein
LEKTDFRLKLQQTIRNSRNRYFLKAKKPKRYR